MRIELARTGNWNGQVLTEEHLKQVVETFEEEVPIVLDHLKADRMPACRNVLKNGRDCDPLPDFIYSGFCRSNLYNYSKDLT